MEDFSEMLQALLGLCNELEQEDRAAGLQPDHDWTTPLSSTDMRFIVEHERLCGMTVCLQAQSPGCWLRAAKDVVWVAQGDGGGNTKEGVVCGIKFSYLRRLSQTDNPADWTQPAVEIETIDGRWLLPLVRLDLPGCKAFEPLPPPVDYGDLVPLAS